MLIYLEYPKMIQVFGNQICKRRTFRFLVRLFPLTLYGQYFKANLAPNVGKTVSCKTAGHISISLPFWTCFLPNTLQISKASFRYLVLTMLGPCHKKHLVAATYGPPAGPPNPDCMLCCMGSRPPVMGISKSTWSEQGDDPNHLMHVMS